MSEYDNENETRDSYDSRNDSRNDTRYEIQSNNHPESNAYVVQAPVSTTAQVSTHIDDDADGQAFRLYMAALDRTPDSAGLANWMSVIRSGVNLDDVASGFVNSAEFQQNYGSLENGEYINQLYHNVLHREPDAGGYANWVNAIESGQSRESILVGFSESEENRMHAAELVHGVDYQTWVG